MFQVYILRSKLLGRFYVRHTDNLERRVSEHRNGYNRSTRLAKDWDVIHTESFESRILAAKKEKYLKSGRGRELIKKKFSF